MSKKNIDFNDAVHLLHIMNSYGVTHIPELLKNMLGRPSADGNKEKMSTLRNDYENIMEKKKLEDWEPDARHGWNDIGYNIAENGGKIKSILRRYRTKKARKSILSGYISGLREKSNTWYNEEINDALDMLEEYNS